MVQMLSVQADASLAQQSVAGLQAQLRAAQHERSALQAQAMAARRELLLLQVRWFCAVHRWRLQCDAPGLPAITYHASVSGAQARSCPLQAALQSCA